MSADVVVELPAVDDPGYGQAVADVVDDKAAKLPAGTAVICQRYVSDSLLASRLPLPSKVTKLPVVTFCVTPALATGAVLGLLQPAPGKRPKTAEQPLLPPPPQATSKVVSKVTEATRNVFFMGYFTCKESG